MERRSPLTDVAGLGLLAWGILLGYISVPTLLSHGPTWDGGISVIGAVLAAGHLAAAIGVTRRAAWGRRLGLAMGALGLFGSASVLITLTVSVISSGSQGIRGFLGLPLAIPAAMVAAYALILVFLLRAGPEFRRSA